MGPGYRGRFKTFVKIGNILKRGAWRPADRLSRFYAGGRAKVRACKVMYNQLVNPFALGFLRRHRELRILHLRRENLLKAHVSRLLMKKRDRVQTKTPVGIVRTHVDPGDAIRAMRFARARYEHFGAQFAGHECLPLSYEKLFDGQRLEVNIAGRICDFLEIERRSMQSTIIKLNPESLADMVKNYEELAEAILRTEFADMLD
jgi:hypothetical protein